MQVTKLPTQLEMWDTTPAINLTIQLAKESTGGWNSKMGPFNSLQYLSKREPGRKVESLSFGAVPPLLLLLLFLLPLEIE